MLMAHAQSTCAEDCAVPPPDVMTALGKLYIISSAAAQRGAYAQVVRDSQWRTLAQRTQEAAKALSQHDDEPETHAIVLLRQLAALCQGLVDRHVIGQEIPFVIWREVARLGRDAFECITQGALCRASADA